ncbi:heat-inducible transcriptional repressor HrcA [Mycoplasmopsis gallinarum]|uniref:Heat-inducible transcription repressor HrcA n=1 Tax=Mycoplasmopsis gallinarum TaxID=29557 RepID=A0A168R8E1_9BACT|nr:heat-inducible transcriptional repressor HrcA [Mycoplasmopsis gallinarum]OAB48708.1 Heat-inducible transcription repressor HrcA [Mycoplasmopsis gallinarum]
MNFEDNEKLNEEKKLILKHIVDLFIKNGEPVGSKVLVEEYNLTISSAKVRYIMSELEEKGYLIKSHASSGRIPSDKGYLYYANYLSHNTDTLKSKFRNIFRKKYNSNNLTLEQAAEEIAQLTSLTLSIVKTNDDEVLKSIQLTPLDNENAIIIMVTSLGNVTNKKVSVDAKHTSIDDVRIAVKIFNDRLIDVPLNEIPNLIQTMEELLKEKIENYQYIFEQFATNVFNFELQKINQVYGKDKIILADEIERKDIVKILDLIEKHSIWQELEVAYDNEQQIKIDVRKDNSAIITKKLNNSKIEEISVIGSKQKMDYQAGLEAIAYLANLAEQENLKNKE